MEVTGTTVHGLLSVLGAPTLRLVGSPARAGTQVSYALLHDPRDLVPRTAHGLLLGVGLDPADPELAATLRQAALRGVGAVVLKSHGADLEPAVAAADEADVALLVAADEIEWLQLERMLSSAIAGSGGPRTVALSSLAVGDLFALANAIATATGGATAIEDLGRRILAYSTVAGQPIDPERREGILGRQVPDLPANDEQYHRLYGTPGVVRFPASPGPHALPRVACAVRAGREPLGSIWLVDDGGLAADTEGLLAEAAEIAALHLLRSRSHEDFVRQRRTDLVRQLVEGSDPSAAAAGLGIPAGAPVAVLALEPRSAAGSGTQDLARLLDVLTLGLEARVGPTGCLAGGGRIYAVLAATRVTPERVPGAVAEVLRTSSTAARWELRAGIGGFSDQPRDVRRSRFDADQVLTLLGRHPELGAVRAASEVGDELVLLRLADRFESAAALSAPASAVLRHDAHHQTGYADLLLAWCDLGRDVRRVAERLTLHPNTVRYRLGRATALFDLALDQPAQVLLLWLALRLERSRG